MTDDQDIQQRIKAKCQVIHDAARNPGDHRSQITDKDLNFIENKAEQLLGLIKTIRTLRG